MPKSSSQTEPKAARPKYPEDVREAVKLAVAARGTKNGAPGPKQHALVRKALGDAPDPRTVLKAAGVKSEKALREMADGSSDRATLKELHAFAAQFDDPFVKGRNLASILVARVEQLKADR